MVEPVLKVTVPVSVPAATEETFAVSVTLCPNVDEAEGVVTSAVALAAVLTVKLKFPEIELAESPFPEYIAVSVCEPPSKAEVVNVARPALSTI